MTTQLTDVEKVARRAGITENEARSVLFGGERGRRWIAPLKVQHADHAAKREEADDDGDAERELVLDGYSAVFDEPTMLYSWLQETIKRGAFKDVLARDPDVRLLVNHAGVPFARTSNDTLRISERPRGLFMKAILDEQDPDARSLHRKVDTGLLSQQSFAFTIEQSTLTTCECDTWDCDCVWEREITRVGELYEVSVVTFPAYPTTSVGVARESSEQSDERDAQAGDAEQRDEASDIDTSPACSSSDHAAAIRLRTIALTGAHTHVTDPEGAPQGCC